MYRKVLKCTIVHNSYNHTCTVCTALCDSVRGPTFLDVRDEVGVSTQAMSYTFMLAAIGGLGGCIVGKH